MSGMDNIPTRVPTDEMEDDDDDEEEDDEVTGADADDEEAYHKLTLKQMASRACKHIDIGTAIMPKPLFTADVEDYDGSEELRDAAQSVETHYARVCRTEFNAIIVEHHMKWAPLCVAEPGPLLKEEPSDRLGRYDFHHSDGVVDWALSHGLKVKGHVLVWAASSPKFLKEMDAQEVRTQLKRHIFTTMAHYRGRIQVWDVVNEPLAPDGSLAENVFLRKLGPSYIEDAFRWAHEADPTAKLLLNENKVEGVGTTKSEKFYELMTYLKKDKGVPIHGVGLQAHFNAAGTGRQRLPTPWAVKQQIRRLGDLGLSVNISEMDVRVSKLPPNVRQIAQRQIYHDIVAAALSEPALDGIWLWGFTDRHTWVTHFYYDDEPLIFDEDFGRKEAYYGLRDAISSLCPGSVVGGKTSFWKSDIDKEGNHWGHLWMAPEPDITTDGVASGEARPDWQLEAEKEMDSGAMMDGEPVGVSHDVHGNIVLSKEENATSSTYLPPIS